VQNDWEKKAERRWRVPVKSMKLYNGKASRNANPREKGGKGVSGKKRGG